METIIDDHDCRSPSPDPIYNTKGERVNIKEVRYKENIVRERNNLIEECMKIKDSFVPPTDYKPPVKKKKIFIGENMASSQFVLNDSTQKRIESLSGCKVSIRGKGSNRIRKDPDDDDRLHVMLHANNDDQIDKGVELIEKILKGEDDFNKGMSQIARISEFINTDYCENCHELGHKTWACSLQAIKSSIRCTTCGETSHITKDCLYKNDKIMANQPKAYLNVEQEFVGFLEDAEGSHTRARHLIDNYASNDIINQIGERQSIKPAFITDEVDHNQFLRLTYKKDQNNPFDHEYGAQSLPEGNRHNLSMNMATVKNNYRDSKHDLDSGVVHPLSVMPAQIHRDLQMPSADHLKRASTLSRGEQDQIMQPPSVRQTPNQQKYNK